MTDKNKALLIYANLCNDEYGEYCEMLVELNGTSFLGMLNKRFMEALCDEIEDNLKNFQENTTIINGQLKWNCE